MFQAVTLFAAAYTLVSGVVERGEVRSPKTPASLRLACVAHAPSFGAHPLGPPPPTLVSPPPPLMSHPPPLVALTAPTALPHDSSV